MYKHWAGIRSTDADYFALTCKFAFRFYHIRQRLLFSFFIIIRPIIIIFLIATRRCCDRSTSFVGWSFRSLVHSFVTLVVIFRKIPGGPKNGTIFVRLNFTKY